MMRSLFSGVAGLKTHQTKMDVIGNNIANVNTTAFKSSSVTFSEMLYQTTSSASAPNAATGRGGKNPTQIGLGVQQSAISTKITAAGSAQTTGSALDIRITGDSFFVVSDGVSNYFTRDGSFYVDAAGNLAMKSNGYNVMGWQVDNTTGTIKKDTVSALRVMSAANMVYPPEATTQANVSGILDKFESDAASESGKTITLGFYDALGYSYTAKFAIHETATKGQYTVELADILNASGDSIREELNIRDIGNIATIGKSGTLTDSQVLEVVSGYSYDLTNKNYTKTVAYRDILAGYSNAFDTPPTAYKGATATAGQELVDQDKLNAGDEITFKGKSTFTSKDLESSPYNLVFKNGVYYYNNGTDKDTALPNPATAQGELEMWQKSLEKAGISNVSSVSVASDGSVEIEYSQTFKVSGVDSELTYSAATGNFGYILADADIPEAYGLDTKDSNKKYDVEVIAPDVSGRAQVTTTTTYTGSVLTFDTDTGLFKNIDGGNEIVMDFADSATSTTGESISLGNFSDINIDWRNVTWFDNGGTSTIGMESGRESDGIGAGRALGNMSGITISNNGQIYGAYDNGMNRLLGQIAVAKFANAAGLEKAGDNLYKATLNSGEFDGIGVDITADGAGSMTTGQLEMSNVDLASEFTDMITTQRGFQANSRIITVSDSMIEELTNLKR